MPNTILKRWNGSAFEELYPKTTVTQISASGTASSSTFLRGDGQWATATDSTKLPLAGGIMNLLSGTTSAGIFFNTAQQYIGPQIRGKVQELYRDYYLGSYKIWDEGNDGEGSGLNADLLDNQQGSFYQNAGNLNAGTVPTIRLGSGTANSTTFLRGDNTWATPAGSGATYSAATLYVKRIWSRTIASGSTWTLRYNAGTGNGTAISTTTTFTAIGIGYTPATTDQFMIEFSNSTNNSLERGICIVGHGTFSATVGMAVISYDAYETIDATQLKLAKYFAQWRVLGTNLEFRYGSKLVW